MTEPVQDPIWERPWPSDGLEGVEACPICGASEKTTEIAGMLDNVFFAASGRWTLQRCAGCHSAYLDPRPTPATIGAAYATYYTHQGTPPPSRAGLVRRIYFAIVDLYIAGRYRSPGVKGGILAGLIATLMPPLANRQDSRHRWLDRCRPGMSLLDAGCGSGDFLSIARDVGWQVEGLDLDERAVEVARGLGVKAQIGTLASLRDDLGAPYDAITMNHVIEHVYDPRHDLELAHGLLKQGGLLFLETPNIDALNLQRFGIHWRGLEAPRHLTLFNPRSLVRLLGETGFVDIRVRRHVVFDRMFEASSQAEAAFEGRSRPRRATLLERLQGHFAAKPRLEFITVTARRSGA